jgi:hypothetical protein
MSLPRFWAFLAVALPVVAALVASLSTVDLTYQLRAGADILASSSIPRVDSWTYTVAGQPWFDQQWGAQVALSAVYQVIGWTGLALLRAGLVAAIVGCLFVIARWAGLTDRGASLLTIGAFLIAAPALALRPQLFGMVLFAVVLLLLADRREHSLRCWAIPLVVLVWANVHGSFFLGPLVVGLTWFADVRGGAPQPHRLLAVAFASVVAACVTPFGPAVWTYAASLSVDPFVTQRISEWQRTWMSLTDPAAVLFVISAVAVIGLLISRRAMVRLPMLVWLGVFAAIGLYAIRGVAWWGLAIVPVVAALLTAGKTANRPVPIGTLLMQRLNLILAALLVAVAVAFVPIWRPVDPATGAPLGLLTDAPPGITAAVESSAHPGDHLFAPQPWGSWFEFATPDLPVAVNSRIELFPAPVWADYDSVVTGQGDWQGVLARWDVALVIVAPPDQAFEGRLVAAGWRSRYTDADGSVFSAPGD